MKALSTRHQIHENGVRENKMKQIIGNNQHLQNQNQNQNQQNHKTNLMYDRLIQPTSSMSDVDVEIDDLNFGILLFIYFIVY
jgi:hypothetical protein